MISEQNEKIHKFETEQMERINRMEDVQNSSSNWVGFSKQTRFTLDKLTVGQEKLKGVTAEHTQQIESLKKSSQQHGQQLTQHETKIQKLLKMTYQQVDQISDL